MAPPITQATDGPIGVVVAVREELAAVCRRLSPVVMGADRHDVFEGTLGGRSVVVARSGMGSARAERAVDLLVQEHCVSALVIAGFAGGLRDGLSPGDLVVATSAVQVPSAGGRADVLLPDPGLLDAARRTAADAGWCHTGVVASVPSVVASPEAKRELASRVPGAVAVDMETAAAAGAAIRAGMPWVAVRAVTDGVDDTLPGAAAAEPDAATGEPSRRSLALGALARPWTIPALLALGRRSSLAAGNLAAFLETLMQALEDWAPPGPTDA